MSRSLVSAGVSRRSTWARWQAVCTGAQGLRQVLPGPALQNRVMNAIYGEAGVKAGFVSGQCMDDICAALEGLAEEGIDVVILGCTELPLLLPGAQWLSAGGRAITLVDPADILAKRCVAYAMGAVEPEVESGAPHLDDALY
ncbi:aspartate racemase [Caballeronia udeis]|uniref:Aspartate racemase n=1 Tax=Caballeronia udeis TaxID=1232866 RepID=A0A158I7F5_9BURK|nr:aspartate racemase [Caballeronia udeis]